MKRIKSFLRWIKAKLSFATSWFTRVPKLEQWLKKTPQTEMESFTLFGRVFCNVCQEIKYYLLHFILINFWFLNRRISRKNFPLTSLSPCKKLICIITAFLSVSQWLNVIINLSTASILILFFILVGKYPAWSLRYLCSVPLSSGSTSLH